MVRRQPVSLSQKLNTHPSLPSMNINEILALFALLPAVVAAQENPPVSSDALQELVTQEGLMSNLEKLNEIAHGNGGNRAFGHPGYAESVNFIYGEVSKLPGFRAWKQDFPATFTNTTAEEFAVGDESFRTVALLFTPSTSDDGVTAELVLAPEGEASCDGANYDATGKIVLVERGPCPDGTSLAAKVRAGAAAGAVAVILYNSDPTKLTAASLAQPSPDFVPAAIIDQEPGQALKKRIEAGEVIEAHATIVQIIEERITQNVFAETEGGDPDNVVLLGAHLDSVEAGPGINDNGSGTSLILELAKALSHFSTDLKVRFAWWGAEETGLWGSRHYVNNLSTEQIDSLLLYLNYDTVSRGYWGVFDGDGSEALPAGPEGSGAIEKIFVDYFVGEGLEVTPIGLISGTDYIPFMDVIDKPVGGLFTGVGPEEDACYHQACDDIDNPDPDVFTQNGKAAAHVLSVLAADGRELVPKRPLNETAAAVKRSRDPFSLEMREIYNSGHGKLCDHGVI